MKSLKKHIIKLDQKELKLSKSLDKGEWRTISNLQEEKKKLKKAAENYFRKKKNSRGNMHTKTLGQELVEAVKTALASKEKGKIVRSK